jgi:PTS system mannose-specific IIA component
MTAGADATGDGRGGTMIGLVLVTHGRLGEEFIAVVEHIVGPQSQVRTVCILPEDDMESRRGDIVAAVREVDGGAGVIVLTDMFGGTPCNLALSILDAGRVEVIAGVNLPMLIKIASERGSGDLPTVIRAGEEAGHKYIKVASAHLPDTRA